MKKRSRDVSFFCRQTSTGRSFMSLVKTWYSPEAAADKFGIQIDQLMVWVTEGLVRAEKEGEKVVRVNIDDVRIEVETLVSRSD
jgi:hypothetical protein